MFNFLVTWMKNELKVELGVACRVPVVYTMMLYLACTNIDEGG